MEDQKRSQFDTEWQIIRVRLDFSTYEGTIQAIKTCDTYVFRNVKPTIRDLYKVINLYAATVMGLEAQHAKASKVNDYVVMKSLQQRIGMIQSSREELGGIYHKLPKSKNDFKVDNVKRLRELGTANTEGLRQVHQSLRARYVGATKKPQELMEYIRLLEFELGKRQAFYNPAGVN